MITISIIFLRSSLWWHSMRILLPLRAGIPRELRPSMMALLCYCYHWFKNNRADFGCCTSHYTPCSSMVLDYALQPDDCSSWHDRVYLAGSVVLSLHWFLKCQLARWCSSRRRHIPLSLLFAPPHHCVGHPFSLEFRIAETRPLAIANGFMPPDTLPERLCAGADTLILMVS